jgi:hypothetical protein
VFVLYFFSRGKQSATLVYRHVEILKVYFWSIADFLPTLQRHNTENVKQIFPEKKLCGGHSPNFHIHVSVRDLYISPIICGPILGINKSLRDT